VDSIVERRTGHAWRGFVPVGRMCRSLPQRVDVPGLLLVGGAPRSAQAGGSADRHSDGRQAQHSTPAAVPAPARAPQRRGWAASPRRSRHCQLPKDDRDRCRPGPSNRQTTPTGRPYRRHRRFRDSPSRVAPPRTGSLGRGRLRTPALGHQACLAYWPESPCDDHISVDLEVAARQFQDFQTERGPRGAPIASGTAR
jgi:hypothetical protein